MPNLGAALRILKAHPHTDEYDYMVAGGRMDSAELTFGLYIRLLTEEGRTHGKPCFMPSDTDVLEQCKRTLIKAALLIVKKPIIEQEFAALEVICYSTPRQ